MGDFNIDVKSSNSGKARLENFCDPFSLRNLVNLEIASWKTVTNWFNFNKKPLTFEGN